MLNPRHLDAFAAVVRTGSTIAAADALNTSQPSISRMLAALSAETGITLFEKSSQRLRITQEGQLFYEEVVRFYDGLDHLQGRVAEIRTLAKSELRVASILAASIEVVPKALCATQEQHPRLKTICNVRSHSRVVDMVAAGHADIGVCNKIKLPEGAKQVHAWSPKCVVAIHPDNPLAEKTVVTLSDLEDANFVSLGEFFNSTYAADPNVAERLNTATQVVNLSLPAVWRIRDNKGAAVIDPFTASLASQMGLLVKEFDEEVTYPISLIQTTTVPQSVTGQQTLDSIAAEIENLLQLHTLEASMPETPFGGVNSSGYGR